MKHREEVIMQFLLVLVHLFVVTFGRDANCGCDHIRRVVVCSRMDLTDLKGNSIVCGYFENIDISENNIKKFPDSLHEFRSVDISHNSLKNLDVSVNQRVEILDITGNNLVAINLKDYFHNLRHLDASNNNLGFAKDNFIEGNCNIIHLDLSKNLVTSLQTVTKCKYLSVLLATDNVISELSENLSSLRNLKKLDLARNKLMYVHRLPPNLETLDISGNRITRVNPRMFQGLMALTYLNLDGNKIKSIEPGTFSSLETLETLKLNSNDMKILTKEMFLGLKSLKVAELCFNLIVQIYEDTFSDLPALEKLMLARNKFLTLPSLRLGKNVKLVQLMWSYISHLNLKALTTMFSGSAGPRRISFPVNMVRSVDPQWIDVVQHFTWECVEFGSHINSRLKELPADYYTNKEMQYVPLGGEDCVCVVLSNSRGMTFDTCVVDNDEIDGLPWIVAVEMSAQRGHFARDDL